MIPDDTQIVYDNLLREIAEADIAYYEEDMPVMEDADYDGIKRQIAEIEAAYPAIISPNSPTQKLSLIHI